MNNKATTLYSLMILIVVLSGCGSRTTINKRNYILEVSRSLPRQESSKDIILDVESFNIDTAFSTKSLLYRKGQAEYEADFYNQFLISPEDMLSDKTRGWLSESGLFKLVLEPGSYSDATHVLEGNIIALYGDFREKLSPKATMKIRFFLVKLSDKSVVFTKTYESINEAQSKTAGALVEAFDKCLINILSNLEQDLQKQL